MILGPLIGEIFQNPFWKIIFRVKTLTLTLLYCLFLEISIKSLKVKYSTEKKTVSTETNYFSFKSLHLICIVFF